jgi:hypothetical protein
MNYQPGDWVWVSRRGELCPDVHQLLSLSKYNPNIWVIYPGWDGWLDVCLGRWIVRLATPEEAAASRLSQPTSL